MRLQATNIHKTYVSGTTTTEVLRGLDLEAKAGEMIMIMGPSGSGKTTLLNILGGIDKPDSGTVTVEGNDITALDQRGLNRYRRDSVGFIFQFYNLIPTLNTLENIELGLETVSRDKRSNRERAMRYLKLVDLEDKATNLPQELSGGEQQRVAIARALCKEPSVVLADEPTGNLDEELEGDVMRLMQSLQAELGMTFFIVSHNSRLTKYMDRTMLLRRGKLTVKGD